MRNVFAGLLIISMLIGDSSATQIDSADRTVALLGENITFTGSGFIGTNRVTFFHNYRRTEASYDAVSDTTLEVTLPDLFNESGEHFLLVEAAGNATVSLHDPNFPGNDPGAGPGNVADFKGNGPLDGSLAPFVVVKAGAVATSLSGSSLRMIYVESGAVIQNVAANFPCRIFAEDGATLDFRGTEFTASTSSPSVFYGSGTTILGDLPEPRPAGRRPEIVVRDVGQLSLSAGIGTFTTEVEVNVTAVGNGTVTMNPDSVRVRPHQTITLTATPGPGAAFVNWSGDVTSNETVIQFSSGGSGISLVATFVDGFALTTYPGEGGTITTDPPGPTHPDGQTVNLVASAAPGYEFVRWGGDPGAVIETNTSLSMDANKIASAYFRPIPEPMRPNLTSVDHPAVPVGSTMTFDGANLDNIVAASLYVRGYEATANFNTISADGLEIEFPDSNHGSADNQILIEGTGGSTVTLPHPDAIPLGFGSGGIQEFDGFGSVSSFEKTHVILNPGAVATSYFAGGFIGTRFIYVRRGAVLQDISPTLGATIYAEDGATLDFSATDYTDAGAFSLFYSPGTILIGSLPTPREPGRSPGIVVRQLTPLSLSRDLGPFGEAVPVDVNVVGDGSVSVAPDVEFIRTHSQVTFTAAPTGSSVFDRWSGTSTSTNPTIELSSGNQGISLTAHFLPGFRLQTYSGHGGTISPDPDAETYAAGQIISLTATPAAGFEFAGWAGHLSGETSTTVDITMDDHKSVGAVFLNLNPASPPQLSSTDTDTVPVGDTITFTGSGLATTSKVSFWRYGRETAATFQAVADDTLEVTLPDISSDGHFVLVQTDSGATVSLATPLHPEDLVEFSGFGQPNASSARWLVIRQGAFATGIQAGFSSAVHVEQGAVLQLLPSGFRGTIFATDGAILDFSNLDPDLPGPSVIYSAGATIIGDLPIPRPPGRTPGTIVREVGPIALSHDVGTFAAGCALDLTVSGPGSVQVSPQKDFYREGDVIQVTAVPGADAHFVRWGGLLSTQSMTETLTLILRRGCNLTARFSDRPDFFSDWRGRFFTEAELADPSISGLNADPDGDGYTNAAEYAFGTNPTVAEHGRSLSIRIAEPGDDGPSFLIDYFRPVNALDITYQLRASRTLEVWQDGISGDLPFEFVEQEIVDEGQEMERVTIGVTFPDGLPSSAFFQLNADIEDIN